MLGLTYLKSATSQALTALAYPPELQGVCWDHVKGRFLLLLDRFPESADGLGAGEFDRKYMNQVVALHDTVEFEGERIRSCQRQRWMRNVMNQKK
jgi:hypothetical protein